MIAELTENGKRTTLPMQSYDRRAQYEKEREEREEREREEAKRNAWEPPAGEKGSPVRHLTKRHFNNLRARGLSKDTIRKAKIRSEFDGPTLAQLANHKWQKQCGGAIVIP